jgi:hypothetical protein
VKSGQSLDLRVYRRVIGHIEMAFKERVLKCEDWIRLAQEREWHVLL